MEKIEGIIEKLENLKILFNNEKKEILKEFKNQVIDDFKDFLYERAGEMSGAPTLGLFWDIKAGVCDYILCNNWIFKNWVLDSLKKDYKKLIYLIINLILDYLNKGECLKVHKWEKGKCKTRGCFPLFKLTKIKKGELKAEIWGELKITGIIRD